MFRLIKIELAKAYYSRYIWIGLACCLALVIGFGALLNADDLFESTNAEQTALEKQYENEDDWKAKMKIEMELNQSLKGIYSQEEIEVKNQILQYKIDHDLEPHEHNTAWDFITYTFQMLNAALMIIAVWAASEVVISEYTNKTYKLTYTKPYTRTQILLSKYIAVFLLTAMAALAMFLMAWAAGGIIFGFDGFHVKTAVCLYGKMKTITLFGESVLHMAGALLKAVMIMSLVFVAAVISKNQIITIIIGIVCALWGRMFAAKLIDNGVSFMKYSMFIHFDINHYIDAPMQHHFSMGMSCAVLLVHAALFVSGAVFINKREDL